jgi:hypothetical protein
MTTQSIKIAGASFSKHVSKLKLPYIDLASGYYLFGTDAAHSLDNLAYGASIDLTAISSPTYGTGYATVGGANGFDTGLLLDTPYTQIAVGKIVTAGTTVDIFGRGGGADGFVGMLRLRDVASPTVDTWPNGAQNVGLDNLQSSSFLFLGARWGGTGTFPGVFAHNGTTLQVTDATTTLTKTVTPTTNLRIGTTYISAVGATVRVAAIALFPSVLTNSQISEIYTYLKALLATRSVTVL